MRSIGMFFNVYIANKIGSEAIGVYQLIVSIYLFATTLANSGIHLATTRIIAEQEAFGKKEEIQQASKKCFMYSLLMGCFAGLVLFLFSPFLTTFYLHNKISALPLRILACSLPFLSVSSCMNGYFSALRNVKKTIFSQVFAEFFKMTAIYYLINYLFPVNLEYSCISLVLGSTLAEFVSFLFLLFCFLKETPFLHTRNNKKNYTKQILKISLPIAFTSYIRSGLSSLKQLLIPIQLEKFGLSCENALSSYGIINGMVMPLLLFPCTFISSFSALLIPEFSYMNAKKEKQKMNFAFSKIFQFCFLFSFFIMGFFWCFAKELNQFLYPNVEISFFLQLLCPLIVFLYIDNVVDSILKGLDKQVGVMGINILDLVSTITFLYFLLPLKGIKGYLFVLFFSEILNGVLSLHLLQKHTHFSIDYSNWLLKPLLSIFLLNFLFSHFFCIQSFLDFLFSVCIFGISYCILLFLLGSLTKKAFRF